MICRRSRCPNFRCARSREYTQRDRMCLGRQILVDQCTPGHNVRNFIDRLVDSTYLLRMLSSVLIKSEILPVYGTAGVVSTTYDAHSHCKIALQGSKNMISYGLKLKLTTCPDAQYRLPIVRAPVAAPKTLLLELNRHPGLRAGIQPSALSA